MAYFGNDPCYLSVSEIGGLFRKGALSSWELTDYFISKISKFDGHYHSYARVMGDSARIEAKRADEERASGLDRGALHGIPVAIKDLIDSKGIITAAGMAIRADNVPDEDATVLRRLRAAGAVILGKLTLTEGASLAHHPTIPAPLNPWNVGHSSGFSSSGSGVAVAAGLCAAALGTDTGGSIRIPASFNGLTGLKPTWGRVSRHGVFPLAQYLDTIGPIARTAAGTAAVLGAIAGADPDDPTAESVPVPPYLATIEDGISGVSIGVDWGRIDADCEPAVAKGLRTCAAILAERGARLRSVTLPTPEATMLIALSMAGISDAHRATYPARAEEFGPVFRTLLDSARAISGMDVAAAIDVANAYKAQLRALFNEVNLILVPAMTQPAPLVGEFEKMMHSDPAAFARATTYTLPFNVSGGPTITFPMGFSGGLPIAAQIIGPHFSESLLLRAAHNFQGVTDWHLRRPILSGATA